MRNVFAAVALILPLVAFAQAETETPVEVKPVAPPVEPVHAAVPVDQPIHAAVPVPTNWNVGAGITFSTGLTGIPLSALVGGLGGLGGLSGTLGVSSQPRMTLAIERRLNEYLFVGFGAGVSFSTSQSDNLSGFGYRSVNVDGTIGLRRIMNPGGVVEVSWFANVGVSYANSEIRSMGASIDPVTGMINQNTPQVGLSQGFAFGAATGITLERELLSGLALRLSSSILGLGYGSSSTKLTVSEDTREGSAHSFDGGLRFSPTIELRYAF